MFSFFASFIKTAFWGLLINEYLQHKYPEKYNQLLVVASYNLIYLYSRGQLFFIKVNNNMRKLIEEHSTKYPELSHHLNKILKNEKIEQKNTIEYILNGKQIFIDNIDSTNVINAPSEYDFIIITENENNRENQYKNKRIIKKIQDWDNKFEESKIRFILAEATLQKEQEQTDKKEQKEEETDAIKVEFKTDEYNFFIVNNVFDEKFMIYFLTTYYAEEFKHADFKLHDISISILDENVVGFEYNIKNDYIYVAKTNYFRKTDIITED